MIKFMINLNYLNTYLQIYRFETIRLGDEIKPFLLVVASVIEDNSIDERLRIDDTEYARIELSFDNATLIPTIIKDAKSNLPSILDGFSAGYQISLVSLISMHMTLKQILIGVRKLLA